MSKIYLTQLRGVLQKIIEKHEDMLEDSARLIAQSILSDGSLYVYGEGDMEAVEIEATLSPNALPSARRLTDEQTEKLGPMDCVLMFFRGVVNEKVLMTIKKSGAVVIGVSALKSGDPTGLEDMTDLYIQLNANSPLVPINDEKKGGQPSTIAALFTYHLIYFIVLEILDEYGCCE